MIKRVRTALVSAGHIATAIRPVRGQKVLLDSDLAVMYGVQTKVLLQAAQRNRRRFPADFMFQLTPPEWTVLRSQIGDG